MTADNMLFGESVNELLTRPLFLRHHFSFVMSRSMTFAFRYITLFAICVFLSNFSVANEGFFPARNFSYSFSDITELVDFVGDEEVRPKNSYSWGKFENFENQAHGVQFNVYWNWGAKVISAYVMEDLDIEGGLLSTQVNLEGSLEEHSYPKTLADAKSLFQSLLDESRSKPAAQVVHSLDERSWRSDEWSELLAGQSFLGFLRSGPVWEAKNVKIFDDNVKLVNENYVYELQFDRGIGFFSRVAIRPVATRPGELSSESEMVLQPLSPSNFQLVSTNVVLNNGPTTRVVTREVRNITDWQEGNVELPFTLSFPPNENDEIILMNRQQVSAQWKDGGIVRTYDGGVAEELATAKFARPDNGKRLRWIFAGVTVLVVGLIANSVIRRRRRST